MSRPRREGEVAQIAVWIDAKVRADVKTYCEGIRQPQQFFVEEALRRELARRLAEVPAPEAATGES